MDGFTVGIITRHPAHMSIDQSGFIILYIQGFAGCMSAGFRETSAAGSVNRAVSLMGAGGVVKE